MVRVTCIIFVVLMVQQTMMVALRIGGAHPDLLWLLPITAALLDGPETGAIVGFWAGLASTSCSPRPSVCLPWSGVCSGTPPAP